MLRTHSKLLHYFTRALRQMNLLESELKVEAKLTFAAGGERSSLIDLFAYNTINTVYHFGWVASVM